MGKVMLVTGTKKGGKIVNMGGGGESPKPVKTGQRLDAKKKV